MAWEKQKIIETRKESQEKRKEATKKSVEGN